MKRQYPVFFALILLAQIILANFLNLGAYIALSFLPVLILSLPVKYKAPAVMLIAFGAGFAADFLSNGVLGLSSLAILPVALAKEWLISLIFGSELRSRGEHISTRRQGVPKMSLALLIFTALFFAVYVPADVAGTRPAGFIALRWLLSTIVSTGVQVFLLRLLSEEE